jgi:hypothetical protein
MKQSQFAIANVIWLVITLDNSTGLNNNMRTIRAAIS